jgi:hypothetical protein
MQSARCLHYKPSAAYAVIVGFTQTLSHLSTDAHMLDTRQSLAGVENNPLPLTRFALIGMKPYSVA